MSVNLFMALFNRTPSRKIMRYQVSLPWHAGWQDVPL
jgi:hypothetical protein